jgi:hypothetical protein
MRHVLFAVSFICALFGALALLSAIVSIVAGHFSIVPLAIGIVLVAISFALKRLRAKRYPAAAPEAPTPALDVAPQEQSSEHLFIPLIIVPIFIAVGYYFISRESSIFVVGQRYNTEGRFTSYYLQVFAAESLMFSAGAVAAIRSLRSLGWKYSAAIWAVAFALFCVAFRYALERHNEYIHFGLLMNVAMIALGIGLVLQVGKRLAR